MFRPRRAVALVACLAVSLFALTPVRAAAAAAKDVVQEPGREIPVLYDVDVVVIGGGLSGFGAAVGAARTGAKTLVVERTGYLGGWLRGSGLGNVLAIKGWRPSIEEGVLADVAKKLVALKAEGYPDLETVKKDGQFLVTNHEMMPQAFQEIVEESGAKILYFSTYADSIVKDGKIEAILVQTPVGRAAIRGKVFIDCTGLATVAAESGAPTKKAEAFMGLASWIGGVDVPKYTEWLKTRPKEGSPELKKWLEDKIQHKLTYFSSTGGGPDMMNYPWDDWWERNSGAYGEAFKAAVEKGELPLYYKVGEKGIVSIIEGIKPIQFELFGGVARPRTYVVGVDPTDIKAVSEAHAKSAQLLFQYTAFLNKNVPGFEKAAIIRLADATIPRAGRSIESNLFDDAKENINPPADKPAKHDDVIAILQRGEKRGAYEVPYGAMVADKIDNLLAVGKSADGGIKFRTHMLAVIMGQGAGTAAAVAVKDNVKPRDVDIRKVQAELRKAGIPLPEKKEQAAAAKTP